MKIRNEKLTKVFEKLMNDIGVTLIDVTPKKESLPKVRKIKKLT